MKKKIAIIGIVLLFIFSYLLLFHHIFSLPKTECILKEEDPLYIKKQTILLKRKENTVIEIIQKEQITSKIENILAIKENEYEKKEFHIKREKNKITGYKKEKEKKEYNKVLKELIESGYTCLNNLS